MIVVLFSGGKVDAVVVILALGEEELEAEVEVEEGEDVAIAASIVAILLPCVSC